MENCKHLEPRLIETEIVTSCTWCGNILQRFYDFEDIKNKDNNFEENQSFRLKCECWAFGRDVPIEEKRRFRDHLKETGQYKYNQGEKNASN